MFNLLELDGGNEHHWGNETMRNLFPIRFLYLILYFLTLVTATGFPKQMHFQRWWKTMKKYWDSGCTLFRYPKSMLQKAQWSLQTISFKPNEDASVTGPNFKQSQKSENTIESWIYTNCVASTDVGSPHGINRYDRAEMMIIEYQSVAQYLHKAQ